MFDLDSLSSYLKIHCSERQNMQKADRENAVLASFLYADDLGIEKTDTFPLAEDAFTTDFRRRVATKINAATTTDKYYSLLSYEIESAVTNTIYEDHFINILAQTPLPFSLAARYHSDIVRDYNNNFTI